MCRRSASVSARAGVWRVEQQVAIRPTLLVHALLGPGPLRRRACSAAKRGLTCPPVCSLPHGALLDNHPSLPCEWPRTWLACLVLLATRLGTFAIGPTLPRTFVALVLVIMVHLRPQHHSRPWSCGRSPDSSRLPSSSVFCTTAKRL